VAYDLDRMGEFTHFISDPLKANDYKIGDFLPHVPGLEKIEWLLADAEDYPIRLYHRQASDWSVYWQARSSFSTSGATNRNVIVGDFDNDGRLEVVGLWRYHAMMVDLETGNLKQTCQFLDINEYSGRPYGWFEAKDFNGNGKQEMVILADLEKHLDVLGWKKGKWVKLWSRYIVPANESKVLVIPGVNPVEDIDGDKTAEIVLSLYNYDYKTTTIGDGKWHVVALEPMTGMLKLDLSDMYLSGMCDLDGDGAMELFVTPTTAEQVERVSILKIYSFQQGNLSIRWQSLKPMDYQTQDINDFPLDQTTSSSNGWPLRSSLIEI